MEIIGKTNPVLILAVLAVIFAVLNIFLWLMVWKKPAGSSEKKTKSDIDGLIKKMNEKIDEGLERNLKMEDQLWGVLDKVKEVEQALNQLVVTVSSSAHKAAGPAEKIKPGFDDIDSELPESVEDVTKRIEEPVSEEPDTPENVYDDPNFSIDSWNQD